MNRLVSTAVGAAFLIASVVSTDLAEAQKKSKFVDPAAVSSTSVLVKIGKRTVFRAIQCYNGKPGETKNTRKGLKFNPYSRRLRTLRRSGNTRSKKFKTVRALNKAGRSACRGNQNTPTPTPSTDIFSGDEVTAYGKQVLEIPSNLSANVASGRIIFSSTCTCHDEKRNETFTYLRSATSRPVMDFSEETLPDQDLAHITAYLNRFR